MNTSDIWLKLWYSNFEKSKNFSKIKLDKKILQLKFSTQYFEHNIDKSFDIESHYDANVSYVVNEIRSFSSQYRDQKNELDQNSMTNSDEIRSLIWTKKKGFVVERRNENQKKIESIEISFIYGYVVVDSFSFLYWHA